MLYKYTLTTYGWWWHCSNDLIWYAQTIIWSNEFIKHLNCCTTGRPARSLMKLIGNLLWREVFKLETSCMVLGGILNCYIGAGQWACKLHSADWPTERWLNVASDQAVVAVAAVSTRSIRGLINPVDRSCLEASYGSDWSGPTTLHR